MGAFYHRRKRHWKTEVVAVSLEMLSGRKKKDYAADALAAQADASEIAPGAGGARSSGGLDAEDPEGDELEVEAVA